MNNWIKMLRLIVCMILLVTLCACGVSDQSSDEMAQLNQQISALEAQVVVLEEELAQAQGSYEGDYEGETESSYADIESLLLDISNSDEELTPVPALITSAYNSEAGCTLTLDRLEINPNYTPGGGGDETYLINPEAVTEEMDGSYAYAQYDGRIEGEISQRFADYVASFEDGAQFTLYMLGDELVLVSEILVP